MRGTCTCGLHFNNEYAISPTKTIKPTIGSLTNDVHWSETMNTLFQTALMANPVLGVCNKCLLSRLQHWGVKSYIVVNSMYAYNTEIRVSGIMAIQGMLFLVRMFHQIILHPHIYSVLNVTLYCVTISLLYNCCLLMRSAIMALYRTHWRTCTSV